MQHDSVTTALDSAISSKGGDLVIVAPPCPDCLYWRPTVQRDHTGGIRGFRMCWVSHGSSASPMKPDFSCFTQKPPSTPDSGPTPAPATPGPIQPTTPAAINPVEALKADVKAAVKPEVVAKV